MWEANGGTLVYVDLDTAKGYAELMTTYDSGMVDIRFIGTTAVWYCHSMNLIY